MENDATQTSEVSQYQLIIQPKLDKFQLQCCSKYLKWRPLVSMQQRRHLRHWSTASSTILCCRPATRESVFCYQAFQGNIGRRRGARLLLRKPATSQKRRKIGPRLLLMTNRKSLAHFFLSSMTLKGHYALFFRTHSSFVWIVMQIDDWMKIDAYRQRRRCRPVALYFGNISFMRIFAGIPWRWASNNSGVIENVDFRLLDWHFRKWGWHYYIVLFSSLSLSTDPKIHDLEWPFYIKFSLLQTADSAVMLHTHRRAYL